MSPEEVTEIDHSLYYEILNILIPRFLRVIGDGTQYTICQAYTKLGERLGPNKKLLSVVKWFHDATFISLPGYIPIHELDPLSIGLFPFDIASACAVSALGIKIKEKPIKVLDLCCCPGGKNQMIHDLLSKSCNQGDVGVNASIIGVDISKPRLQVCISLLDRTARFKFMENSRAGLTLRRDRTTARSSERSLVEGISCSSNLMGVESVIDSGSARDEINTGRTKQKPRLLLFNCDGTRFGFDTFGSLLFDSKVQDDELFHIFGRDKKGRESKVESTLSHLARIDTIPKEKNKSVGGIEVEVGLRKRKNKSARQREQRKIQLVEKNDLHEIFSGEKRTVECSSDGSRVAVSTGHSGEESTVDVETEGIGGTGIRRGTGMGIGRGDESLLSPAPLTDISARGFTEEPPLLNNGTFDYILVDAECSHDGSYRHMRYVSEERVDTDTFDGSASVTGCRDSNSNGCSNNSSSSSSNSSSIHTTMNKPGSAKSYIGSDRVAERGGIVDLQKRLLGNGFRLLRACSTSTSISTSASHAGPSLVYSTCSLDENQNEGVVKWLLDTYEDAELCPLEYSQLCSSSCSEADGSLTQYNGSKSEDVDVAAEMSGSGDPVNGREGEGEGEGEEGINSGEAECSATAEADSRDLRLALSLVRMDQVHLLQAVRASKWPFN
jgi:16S rRNA C967 or C1407 C5-methylase (RsmB/RsmF family)